MASPDALSQSPTTPPRPDLARPDASQPPLSSQPQRLFDEVIRLTAPNPSIMTGPGTNSYLLGQPASGYVVVDPGPELPSHVQQLFDTALDTAGNAGAIVAIVCTHSHADHAPGARPLQALCSAAGRPRPPVIGMPSAPNARPNSHFVPDQQVVHQSSLPINGPLDIRTLHTPGHAANHVCLWLPQHGLLLSGDHILQGSSTIIDPPDGHMGDYLRSLDALRSLCTTQAVNHILPAHGGAIRDPVSAIDALLRHRRTRGARVRAAMDALPHGTPQDWLPLAYADVSPSLWPMAMRSLLAHVEHLQSETPA